MTYRVAFAKRSQSNGSESGLDPSSELDSYLADGVVADKRFVERFESAAEHGEEGLEEEDDGFLGLAAAEVWEYDVVDSNKEQFEEAARNSETVMEFDVIDEASTESSDATAVNLGEGQARAAAAGAGEDADLQVKSASDPTLGLTRDKRI